MAGTDPNFDSTAFRNAIRSTMQMAMPTNVSQQVTFVWNEKSSYQHADPTGVPYDLTATPTTDTPAKTAVVPVAVHFGWEQPQDTAVGQFDTNRVTLTLLDTDYSTVSTADGFRINGVDYVIDSIAPPLGLFDVTVYQIFGRARG